MTNKTIKLLALAIGLPLAANAQNKDNGIQLHGSIQTEFLVPEDDDKIGTEHTNNDLLNNTYLDLNLSSKFVDAGARLEYMQYPLPGFDTEFKGWGVPHLYVKGKVKGAELTIGDFYEQFGSGFILRTYEERALGIDNALRGARVKVNAVDGLRLTALGGVQRTYWDWDSDSRIFGADAEYDLDQHIKGLSENNINWTVGASWVLKNEDKQPSNYNDVFVPGTNYYLNFPRNVNAFDVRSQFHKQNFTILGEYAWKTEDPSADNSYTYRNGSAMMVSASYSKTGFSALVQAKRSEDMAFRSHRGMNGIPGFLNNMPAFAYQHTYALPALYPYATRYCNINSTGSQLVPGEWAFQGELAYNFKRKTKLGGKYGTKVKANFSHVRGLDAKIGDSYYDGQPFYMYGKGNDGYSTSFFGMSDEKYYQDFNIQVDKKLSKNFKLNLMYMNQEYNQTIVEGHGGMIKTNTFVAEGKYQFSSKTTLRAEAQYLTTKHESDDWMYGLVELSVLPHFMFTISDMYGRPYLNGSYGDKEHYYLGSVTYTTGAHRLMLGYGRTRAGYNCSGGVCRWVPASRGIQATYNYTF